MKDVKLKYCDNDVNLPVDTARGVTDGGSILKLNYDNELNQVELSMAGAHDGRVFAATSLNEKDIEDLIIWLTDMWYRLK